MISVIVCVSGPVNTQRDKKVLVQLGSLANLQLMNENIVLFMMFSTCVCMPFWQVCWKLKCIHNGRYYFNKTDNPNTVSMTIISCFLMLSIIWFIVGLVIYWQVHVDSKSASAMFEVLRKKLTLTAAYPHFLSICYHLMLLPCKYNLQENFCFSKNKMDRQII